MECPEIFNGLGERTADGWIRWSGAERPSHLCWRHADGFRPRSRENAGCIGI